MGLFNLFKKKNNEIHAEENKKEELEKLRLEKKVSLAEKEKMMCQLREQIIAEINETPAATYQLAALFGKDAAACFPIAADFQWHGAWFKVDLNTMKLYASVSTYPNQFGACRSDVYHLTAVEFNEKARAFNMPVELQNMETEEDWKALFNEELKAAVEKARRILDEQKEKEKEAQRIAKAVVIPDYFADRKPTMEFNEIQLNLQQRYGYSEVLLTKESEKYILRYNSAHYGNSKRELSAMEAAWVEKEVNDCTRNTDTTTWQSLPGGDMMSVKIYKHHKPQIELICEKPLNKYLKLQHSLEYLTRYGSFSETEIKKVKG